MKRNTLASVPKTDQNLVSDFCKSLVHSGNDGLARKGLHDLGCRHKVLRMLLLAAVCITASLGYINWSIIPSLSIFQWVFASYSLVLFFMSRSAKTQFKISLSFLLVMYSLLLFALALPRETQTVIVWMLAIPVLSHFLLGRVYGFWVSLIFILLSIVTVITKSVLLEESLNIFTHVNQLLASLVILAISHVYEVSRVEAHQELLRLASTDSLTSLANRARLLDVFERDRNYAERNKTDFSMLLIDLDYFKRVNDQFGHDVGDEVLKYVAAIIKHRIRKTDLACRIGGEEFVILLPGANLAKATVVAENIRQTIAALPYTKGDTVIPLSVSIGVSEYRDDGFELETLYAAADAYMYKAKAAGRNQTCSRVDIGKSNINSSSNSSSDNDNDNDLAYQVTR